MRSESRREQTDGQVETQTTGETHRQTDREEREEVEEEEEDNEEDLAGRRDEGRGGRERSKRAREPGARCVFLVHSPIQISKISSAATHYGSRRTVSRFALDSTKTIQITGPVINPGH